MHAPPKGAVVRAKLARQQPAYKLRRRDREEARAFIARLVYVANALAAERDLIAGSAPAPFVH